MTDVPTDLLYTEEHEYLKTSEEDGVFYIGITDYAQRELGDIVYVELPAPGDQFEKMQVFGTIEAVKAVSDLFCPISGEVVEVNDALQDDPALINNEPYESGWLLKIRPSVPEELEGLLDAEQYMAHIGEEDL